jgi:hypothetical protein
VGLYNFAPLFVDGVRHGTLTQTIRGPRLRQDVPGDTMHLYTGLRRKGAELLWRCPCVKVETLVIWPGGEIWTQLGNPLPSGLSELGWNRLEKGIEKVPPSIASHTLYAMRNGFSLLLSEGREAFARADGFHSWAHWIRTWRRAELPFYGGIWHWDYAQRQKEKP